MYLLVSVSGGVPSFCLLPFPCACISIALYLYRDSEQTRFSYMRTTHVQVYLGNNKPLLSSVLALLCGLVVWACRVGLQTTLFTVFTSHHATCCAVLHGSNLSYILKFFPWCAPVHRHFHQPVAQSPSSACKKSSQTSLVTFRLSATRPSARMRTCWLAFAGAWCLTRGAGARYFPFP